MGKRVTWLERMMRALEDFGQPRHDPRTNGRRFRGRYRICGVVAILVLSSGCALSIEGRTQRVTVRSTPSGADVFVNGASAGQTPVDVSVQRRALNPSVRIHKEGFKVEERWLDRGFSPWLVGDVALAVAFGGSGYFAAQQSSGTLAGPRLHAFALGAAGLGAALVLVPTLRSGAAYAFPDEVDVVLLPADGWGRAEPTGGWGLKASLDEQGRAWAGLVKERDAGHAAWRARVRGSGTGGRSPEAQSW